MTKTAHIGHRIRALRIGCGLTQSELAHAAGIRTMTISDTERGLTSPTYATLERLAVALDCPVADIVSGGRA